MAKVISTGKGNFLGATKGNAAKNTNLSTGGGGGGEGHGGAPSGSKFIGQTKGNRDLPINRSNGVSEGHGGTPEQRQKGG
jgi:hypothetical protein